MVFIVLPCDIYPGFVQQQPFDSAVGFLFVHFIIGQLSLLATYKIDILFPGGVATYAPIILQVCYTINSLLP